MVSLARTTSSSCSSDRQRLVDLSAFSTSSYVSFSKMENAIISMANCYRHSPGSFTFTSDRIETFYETIVLFQIQVHVMVVCRHHFSVSTPLKQATPKWSMLY